VGKPTPVEPHNGEGFGHKLSAAVSKCWGLGLFRTFRSDFAGCIPPSTVCICLRRRPHLDSGCQLISAGWTSVSNLAFYFLRLKWNWPGASHRGV
jgi:hypothetical protein